MEQYNQPSRENIISEEYTALCSEIHEQLDRDFVHGDLARISEERGVPPKGFLTMDDGWLFEIDKDVEVNVCDQDGNIIDAEKNYSFKLYRGGQLDIEYIILPNVIIARTDEVSYTPGIESAEVLLEAAQQLADS